MTLMGKILVILNFVVALAVGWLLVVYSATSSNWRAADEQDRAELTASRTNTASAREGAQLIKAERDQLANQLDKLRSDYDNYKKDADQRLRQQEGLTAAQEAEARKSRALAVANEAEAARLRKEVAMHQETVKEREKTIVAQEGRIKELLDRTVAAENNVNSLKVRNEALITQLENLEKRLRRQESGGTGGAIARPPNAKNPPSHYVRGRVVSVDRDNGLVEVSVGTDDGVSEDNTLEVYRLQPRAQYLGTIKVVEAYPHKSVCRVMHTAGARRGTINKGDEVASRISSR